MAVIRNSVTYGIPTINRLQTVQIKGTMRIERDNSSDVLMLESRNTSAPANLVLLNDTEQYTLFFHGSSAGGSAANKTVISNSAGNPILLNPGNGSVMVGKYTSGITGVSGSLDIAGVLNVDKDAQIQGITYLVNSAGVPSSAVADTDFLIISRDTANSVGLNIVSGGNVNTQRGVFKGTRMRGSFSSPTAAANNDHIVSLLGSGYDGTAMQNTSMVSIEADGVVSTNVMPMRITFTTGATTSASRLERMRITSAGAVRIGKTSTGLAASGDLDVAGKFNADGGIVIQAWQTPTFVNSWTQYNSTSFPVRYFKDPFGIVHLKGLINGGTMNTTAFTLPVGYRPDTIRHSAQATSGGTTQVQISTTGAVLPQTVYTSWVSLDGISFVAA